MLSTNKEVQAILKKKTLIKFIERAIKTEDLGMSKFYAFMRTR